MIPDIKQIDEQGIKAWDDHDPETFSNLFAEKFTWIDSATPQSLTTKNQVKEYMQGWFAAFPDMHITQVHRVIDDNGWVASEIEFTGTNSGTLAMGGKEIPATNKQVRGKGVYFAYVEDGKIVEFRSYPDTMGLMAQLGLM